MTQQPSAAEAAATDSPNEELPEESKSSHIAHAGGSGKLGSQPQDLIPKFLKGVFMDGKSKWPECLFILPCSFIRSKLFYVRH